MLGINRSMFLIRNKHGKCVKQERKPLSLQILEEYKKNRINAMSMSPQPLPPETRDRRGIEVVNKWLLVWLGPRIKGSGRINSLSLFFFKSHHHHYQASHSASCTIVIIIVGIMRVHQENILSNGIYIQLDYNLTQTTDIVLLDPVTRLWSMGTPRIKTQEKKFPCTQTHLQM